MDQRIAQTSPAQLPDFQNSCCFESSGFWGSLLHNNVIQIWNTHAHTDTYTYTHMNMQTHAHRHTHIVHAYTHLLLIVGFLDLPQHH